MAAKKVKFDRAWFIGEVKSIAITTMTIFAVDGFGELTALYNGDTSRDIFIALGVILGRSILKAVLQLLFPKIFVEKPKAT